MILVCSAGRSGSGWLMSLFTACGLRCSHEWCPYDVWPIDADAETEWIWNQPTLWAKLKPEDTLIVLDRKEKDRIASVDKLLGKHDWSEVNRLWSQFRQAGSEGVFPNTHFLTYETLFTLETRDKIRHILFTAGHDTSNLNNAFDFLRHMRITNKTAEDGCKASYGHQ